MPRARRPGLGRREHHARARTEVEAITLARSVRLIGCAVEVGDVLNGAHSCRGHLGPAHAIERGDRRAIAHAVVVEDLHLVLLRAVLDAVHVKPRVERMVRRSPAVEPPADERATRRVGGEKGRRRDGVVDEHDGVERPERRAEPSAGGPAVGEDVEALEGEVPSLVGLRIRRGHDRRWARELDVDTTRSHRDLELLGGAERIRVGASFRSGGRRRLGTCAVAACGGGEEKERRGRRHHEATERSRELHSSSQGKSAFRPM